MWLPALIGLGSATLRILVRRAGGLESGGAVFPQLLGGLAALAAVAMIANLLVPLGGWLAPLALVLGWCALLRRRPRGAPRGAAITLGMLALAAAAIVGSGPVGWYDTGLYYAQAVRWATETPTPFGLVNLHGRLAFNSTWHVLAAALTVPVLGRDSGLLAINGLLWIAYGGLLFRTLGELAPRAGAPFSTTFLLLTTLPWLSLARPSMLGSASPDVAVVLLALFSFYAVARSLENPSVHMHWALVAFLVSVFATTVKLSAAPLVLIPSVLLASEARAAPNHEDRDQARTGWMLALPVFLGSLLLVGPWVVRGLVLSGCPAYPVSIGCVEGFDWTVPRAQLHRESLGVLAFGRQAGGFSGNVLDGWDWLPSWMDATSANLRVRLTAGLAVGGVAAWLAAGRRPMASGSVRTYLLTLLGSLVGLAVWFATAPNLRFAEGYLWALSLAVLAAGLDRFRQARSPTCAGPVARGLSPRHLALAMVTAVLVLLVARVLPTSGSGLPFALPQLPEVALRTEQLSSGAPVYVPASGDQCWGAPLPCTPYFDPGLEAGPEPGGALPRWFKAAKPDS